MALNQLDTDSAYMTRLLEASFKKHVEDAITEIVKTQMKPLVRECAIEAIKTWNTHIVKEHDAIGFQDRIIVNFVEKIMNEHKLIHTTTIEVNEVKK